MLFKVFGSPFGSVPGGCSMLCQPLPARVGCVCATRHTRFEPSSETERLRDSMSSSSPSLSSLTSIRTVCVAMRGCVGGRVGDNKLAASVGSGRVCHVCSRNDWRADDHKVSFSVAEQNDLQGTRRTADRSSTLNSARASIVKMAASPRSFPVVVNTLASAMYSQCRG